MEAKLKKELGTAMLKSTGHSGGGCISEGQSYDTDTGRVFVKINHKSEVLYIILYYLFTIVHMLLNVSAALCTISLDGKAHQ